MREVYLDYNASTPIAPEVQEAMQPYFNEHYGNPSALHFAGNAARRAVLHAREQVSSLINCSPDEIVFTSGGSESNNHVLKGVFDRCKEKGNHIITSTIEHPAIINPCKYLEKYGAEITYIGVDAYGSVNPDDVKRAITDQTILISIMHANNEVGTVQPIEEIGKIAKENNIFFHTDASQSIGKLPIDASELGVDFLTIAGHKVYAPKGVGALFIRQGIEIEPLIHGAGHEMGKRAGTENVLLTVGLGKACELAKDKITDNIRMEQLRDYFFNELNIHFGRNISLNGHPEKRLSNTLNINFRSKVGQDILSSIPQLAASTGSACHSGLVNLSPVLKAMNVSEDDGKGAIRFSIGRYTTKDDIDHVLSLIKKSVHY